MLSMMILSVLMIYSLTPIKLAMMVSLMSIWMSIYMYMFTSYSFPSAALVISFSSGMMILFCYCATLSNHESKSNFSITKILVMSLTPVVLVSSENLSAGSSSIYSMEMAQMNFLILAILIVIISMVCINIGMFQPKKSMMNSY